MKQQLLHLLIIESVRTVLDLSVVWEMEKVLWSDKTNQKFDNVSFAMGRLLSISTSEYFCLVLWLGWELLFLYDFAKIKR